MTYCSHTIYRATPERSARVGITIKPTPSLSYADLQRLIGELEAIRDEMQRQS
jgi:hypothetical protein